MYCIDASVIINSEIEGEDFHEYSRDLMKHIREKNIMVFVPEIVCAEISSWLQVNPGGSNVRWQNRNVQAAALGNRISHLL